MGEFTAGIIDAGGVLLDDDTGSVEKDIAETLVVDPDRLHNVMEELTPFLRRGEMDEDDYWKRVIKDTGATGSLPSESLWTREFPMVPHPEVLAIMDDLRSQVILALLSNTIAPHAALLRKNHIFDSFEPKNQILSHKVGMEKPDPRILLLTLRRIHSASSATFFVDNNQDNLNSGEKMGIHGVLYTTPKQLRKDLRALGVLSRK